MELTYFAALVAAFVLGNLLSDVIVAAYVTWTTKRARLRHIARVQEYQARQAESASADTTGYA